MNDTTYNGWSNYQTWAVGLWLDNDQGSYQQVRELIEQASGEAGVLANLLETLVSDDNPLEGSASAYTDLLGHALQSVDWLELAEHMLQE